MKNSLILIFAISIILLLCIGCGEDDIASSQKADGELTDTEFLMAKNSVEGFTQYTSQMFGSMTWMVDTVVNASPNGVMIKNFTEPFTPYATSDSLIFSFHTSSQYWYYYACFEESTLIIDSVWEVEQMIVIDSVQFLHGSTPVQWPDSTLLTGINSGARVEITTTENNSSIVAYHLFTIEGDFFNMGTGTLNGSNGLEITGADSESGCVITIDFDGTATDLVVNLDDLGSGESCPSSGTIIHTGSMSFVCTGETNFNFSDSWNINQTYDNGSVHVVFENSTTRWEFDESCSEPLASALVF
ncbi:MAG: hypothetical protein U9N54_11615 [candidate division Zixibacteria bacterium]|nr:hypothetical protein [candidate division Zixibacteria bacterium]